MKPLLFSLLVSTCCSTAYAQMTVSQLDPITEAEKKMTVCPFDKEADAVILADKAYSDYTEDYRLVTSRRTRIKILNEKGIKRADVEIPFTSQDDFEFITDIEAYVYNFDEAGNAQTEIVSRQQIFRQKVNDRYSLVKIAMPNVKAGSIIEYKYTSNMKHYGGLRDWYFQTELPTVSSNYTLVILPGYEFAYVVHKSSRFPVDIKSEKGSGKISFGMKNIPGLRDEPYMDAARDYIQYVEFQLAGYTSRFGGKTKYMTTWNEVTRELMAEPSFGRQMNKKLSGSSELLDAVKLLASPFEKMAAIYRYVQKNINWNGYGGRFTSDGVKDAWDKKKGSNAEINFILLNLLQDAGLNAYPMLVSERGFGKVNPESPFIDQFNTVMAYVIIDEKKYVLDGASLNTPPHLIPFSVVNTTAFVVDRKKGGIVTLTENEKMDKNLFLISAKVNEAGEMNGTVSVYSYDYARIKRQNAWNRDKSGFKEDYFIRNTPGLTIDSIKVENLENDSVPIEQKLKFYLPATSTGGYKLLNLNLFTGLGKNPFIADNRFTNIDYGCLRKQSMNVVITLPPNLQPETLPKDIKIVMPDKSISILRLMQYKDNTITARFDLETTRSVYTAEEYKALQEFYRKMADVMNEQVVLKEKSNSDQSDIMK